MIGLYELFENIGRNNTSKIAVVQRRKTFTYGWMLDQIDELCYVLFKLGVNKGSKVCLLYRNSPQMLCMYFALMRAGAEISPLNWRETVLALERMCHTVNGEYLFCDDLLEDKGKELGERDPSIKIFMHRNLSGIQENALQRSRKIDALTFPENAPKDISINIFTGGTTGEPKAASHSYHGLLLQLLSCYMAQKAVRNDDVFLNYAPMFHIGGFTAAMQVLCIGGTLVLGDSFDAATILETIRSYGVTQMSLIPPSLCAELTQCKGFSNEQLETVRLVRVSGGSCTQKNIEDIFCLFPKAFVANGYGMSERAVNMLNIIDRNRSLTEDKGNISVGQLSPLCDCRLVDDFGRIITQPNQIGELYGKSPCMMVSYYGREDSFSEDGWFATGDMFYFDSVGNYYFVDRKKDMIKTGGENVYSGEVERVIRQHPAVEECAVVGVPDERFVEAVAAAVVLKTDSSLSLDELKSYCTEHLAGFKKPRKILILETLPKTKIGKISKKAIKSLFE